MQALSELDSSFLFLETDRTPLHAGGIFVFKKTSSRAKFSFNRFRIILESKLGNEPFFRERLVESPINSDLPVWAEDPDFDLDNHLKYINLGESHPHHNLMSLGSEIFSTPVDRSRPLWSATYIDGLEQEKGFNKKHFALVLKVHITAINGITGEDILSQLLHVSPEITEIEPIKEWNPKPLPETESWLGAAYNNVLTLPSKLTGLAKETASSAFYSILYEHLQKLNLPASLMSVAATPINQQISAQRVIENFEIPVTDIRAIRRNLKDVTTNDILMGICAEALSNYLKDMDSAPKAPLIALAPISVRSTSLDIKSGNQLAATLFSLATTEQNPVKRIQLIHETAQSSNSYDAAIAASTLTELVPSCTAALSARVYSEFLLAQKHKPMFNLPITNIPGPQFPLYFEDNELTKYICTAPLFDGIGLALMIVSYNGNYSLTSTYCPKTLTLEKKFTTYLSEALQTIMLEKDSAEFLNQQQNPTPPTGIIDGVTGLVNNLFSLGK
ncbi:MAG: WS/DGAT/MGAT family acyltransferase [Oleiphilaceae bacterium]|jgi:WS/DGAT/MGAT family acyltransferase